MCRMVYLALGAPAGKATATGKPHQPQERLIATSQRRSLRLAREAHPPARVRQALGQQVHRLDSSDGCGCAFESDGSAESGVMMASLAEALALLCAEVGEVRLYSDWDFEQVPAMRQLSLDEVAAQRWRIDQAVLWRVTEGKQ
ncbi:hypothetical protein [Deinococcus radiophilus]|uniref:Uncharacterized protein n=1 Tax=Deinococcus radiophilus TaxID=32062 RepID=A0A431W1W0_9DEIO|nr:hypothetical protein [Deinococcus radiophilus]RTR29464.1 hypothetical protein EJ104_03500 [Deinococcus radiophilus]UFA50701.1 hypothetical protein LMT64_02000 [Deinococcus radiophilus]